jgi:(1->4)-alpha-D-glucan 1-alpha-D-glucosylmutase
VSNSLAQVILRTMAPGVTDTYQGTELWELSLVDPDNRRPVDYDRRRELLDRVRPLLVESPEGVAIRRAEVAGLLERPDDGAVKLYVLTRALRLRRALHSLCTAGEYLPIEAHGAQSEHVLAFARRHEDRWLIAVVTRLPATLASLDDVRRAWGDTALLVPPELAVPVRNLLTEETASPTPGAGGAMLPVSAVLDVLPVALLQPVSAD